MTFHLVAFAWIFFRAESFAAAWDYLVGLGRWASTAAGDGGSLVDQAAGALGFLALLFVLDWIDRNRAEYLPLERWSPAVLGVALAGMVAGLLVFSGGTLVPFIYFQF